MKKSAYIWIFALVLSVLFMFPGCGDDWETFPNYSMEGEYLFDHQKAFVTLDEGIGEITVMKVDCDVPGIVMRLDKAEGGVGYLRSEMVNQLIYAHCD